jgi:hypothetical protein
MYPSAAFLLLIAVELARDWSPRVASHQLAVVGGVLALSLVPNVIALNRKAGAIRDFAPGERVQLGALETLARDRPGQALPGLRVENGVIMVDPAGYFSGEGYMRAVERFGSPALSAAQIASLGGLAGTVADRVLLQGGDLQVGPPGKAFPGSCRSRSVGIPVPRHGLVVRAGGPAAPTVTARRFGPVYLPLPTGSRRSFTVKPPAGSPLWFVQVSGGTACWT